MLKSRIIPTGHLYHFSTDLNQYSFRIRFEEVENKCNTFLKYKMHTDYDMLDNFGWFGDLAIENTVE